MMAIAGQTDFLDGDIDGYFVRTSVEETKVHESLRGIPLAKERLSAFLTNVGAHPCNAAPASTPP